MHAVSFCAIAQISVTGDEGTLEIEGQVGIDFKVHVFSSKITGSQLTLFVITGSFSMELLLTSLILITFILAGAASSFLIYQKKVREISHSFGFQTTFETHN